MITLTEKYYKDGMVDTGEDPDTAVMVGVMGKSYAYTPLQKLKHSTDFKKRLPTKQWWCGLRVLLRNLALHKEHIFSGEGTLDRCNSQDIPTENPSTSF